MKHSHNHHEHSHAIPEDRKAFCPITGDVVDIVEAEKQGHVREYNGKKIYFCCAGCVDEYDKQPEEQIAHKDH
jgi:YHS domain-containing protein